jgi:hypothetical protein
MTPGSTAPSANGGVIDVHRLLARLAETGALAEVSRRRRR